MDSIFLHLTKRIKHFFTNIPYGTPMSCLYFPVGTYEFGKNIYPRKLVTFKGPVVIIDNCSTEPILINFQFISDLP